MLPALLASPISKSCGFSIEKLLAQDFIIGSLIIGLYLSVDVPMTGWCVAGQECRLPALSCLTFNWCTFQVGRRSPHLTSDQILCRRNKSSRYHVSLRENVSLSLQLHGVQDCTLCPLLVIYKGTCDKRTLKRTVLHLSAGST